MRVRHKITRYVGYSGDFNIHAMSEVIVQWDDDGADSMYISDLEVYLKATEEWKDMSQAFKDGDLITDNYNTIFFEPKTEEDRQRGYTL